MLSPFAFIAGTGQVITGIVQWCNAENSRERAQAVTTMCTGGVTLAVSALPLIGDAVAAGSMVSNSRD